MKMSKENINRYLIMIFWHSVIVSLTLIRLGGGGGAFDARANFD